MRTMDISLFVVLFKIFEYCCFPSRSLPLLESVDKLLCRIFTDPRRGSGVELMEAMTLYNWSITSLRECVERQNIVVAKAARDLRAQGGPLFLKQKMSKSSLDLMKIDFKWSEDDVQKMLILRNDVLMNWKVFYKVYKKNKEFYTKVLNDSRVY
ncbi:hypothetical protein J6590_031684 [Homalodisca vitripennis]|nr:hypothetical protein J6590_031684 [Homalodisca vitripennis]